MNISKEAFQAIRAYEAGEKGRDYTVAIELEAIENNRKYRDVTIENLENRFYELSTGEQKNIIFMRNGGFNKDKLRSLQNSQRCWIEHQEVMEQLNSKYENLTGSTSPDCEKVMLLNSNLIKAIDYLIKQKQGEQ